MKRVLSEKNNKRFIPHMGFTTNLNGSFIVKETLVYFFSDSITGEWIYGDLSERKYLTK
jgi:hypothetical protein